MLEKNKIIILCSICTFIFVSRENLSHALMPAQESKRSFGRLLLLTVIQKGHANAGLSSSSNQATNISVNIIANADLPSMFSHWTVNVDAPAGRVLHKSG